MVVALGFASCGHSTPNADSAPTQASLPQQATPITPQAIDEPVVGRTYMVVVDGDTVLARVEHASGRRIEGSYFPLEVGSNRVAPHPFRLKLRRRNLLIETDNREQKLRRAGYTAEELLSGQAHMLATSDGLPCVVAASLLPVWSYEGVEDSRFTTRQSEVQVQRDVRYGVARGYWTSTADTATDNMGRLVREGLRNTLRQDLLPLTLDLYLPTAEAGPGNRPLVMLIHGGGFYVGSKRDLGMELWCRHLAALGYVAASIDYRMGFLPSRNDIERTAYKALQDAHAAMRYLVAHAADYAIDTARLYVGGCSAGAITALNLAYMNNTNRPDASRKVRGLVARYVDHHSPTPLGDTLRGDLGLVEQSGNSLRTRFRLRAVINMWGAVRDLDMLTADGPAILSFHGDADRIVPYDTGFPFSDISDRLGRRLFGTMYGSAAIDQRAHQIGLHSELHTYVGRGHSLHKHDDGSLDTAAYNALRDTMATFLYRTMLPHPAHIANDYYNPRRYTIVHPQVGYVMWQAEGGFLLAASPTEALVVWDNSAPRHVLHAAGRYDNGIGFTLHRNEDNE